MAYCILDENNKSSYVNLSYSGLRATKTLSSWDGNVKGTFKIPAGKWYWELTPKTAWNISIMGGIAHASMSNTSYPNASTALGFYWNNGNLYDGTPAKIFETSTPTTEKTMGLAFDTATGKLWISINGTWQANGRPDLGTNPIRDVGDNQHDIWYPVVTMYSINGVTDANFGQKTFKHKVPEGFNPGIYTGNVLPPIDLSLDSGIYSYDQTLSITASSGIIYYLDDDTGFTTTDFVDTSYSGTHIVETHGEAVSSLEYSKFGRDSTSLLNDGDYLIVPNHSDFDFGAEDFTIDWWEKTLTTPDNHAIAVRHVGGAPPFILYGREGKRYFYAHSGTTWDIASSKSIGTIDIGIWTHFTVVRNGNNFYTFKNGILQSQWTSSLAIADSSGDLSLGRYSSGIYFSHYLSDFRISKGVARWTANFTPPTKSYTLADGIDSFTKLLVYPATVSGIEYTGPITISGTTNIEARSTNAVADISPVITRNYTLDKSFNMEDWSNEFSFNIDNAKVTSPETDFPLRITLSSGTGQNNFDTTGIFDTLETVASGIDFNTRYYSNYNVLDISGTSRAYKITGKITDVDAPHDYPRMLTFNGTSDHVKITNYSDLAFGTADFTIDSWIKTSDVAADPDTIRIISFATDNNDIAIQMFVVDSGHIHLYINSTYILNTISIVDDGIYHHLAITRESGTFKLYIDGILEDSATTSYNLVANCCYIGRRYSANGYFSGSIAGMRITTGEALWTSNFTPPTGTEPVTTNTKFYAIGESEPSDHPHNTTRHVGALYSTSYSYFGSNGVYFDGVQNNNLVVEHDGDFNFGLNDFTVDWWEYSTESIYHSSPIQGGSKSFTFYTPTVGTRSLYISSPTGSWDIASNLTIGTITLNKWAHWALVRSAGVFKVYEDGLLKLTVSDKTTTSVSDCVGGLKIGAYSTNTFKGYLSDIRISNGIARWTSNFRPPNRSYYEPQYTHNNKKIAMTTTVSGAEVQLPVEIAYWDNVNKTADLWTRVPYIDKDLDTVVHLYYDKNKSDNNNFIGDPGSTTSQRVWKDIYDIVFHCGYFAPHDNGWNFKESARAFHATTAGNMMEVDNLINEGVVSFGGSTDYVNFSLQTNPLMYNNDDDWSVTAHLKLIGTTTHGDGYVVFNGNGLVQSNNYWSALGVDDVKTNGTTVTIDDNYHIVTATKSGSNYYIIDDDIVSSNTSVNDTNWGTDSTTEPFRRLGEGRSSIRPSMYLSEVLIANEFKGFNWESMMYYNISDDIFTVSTGHAFDSRAFIFTGYVKVSIFPKQRTVNLYKRSDGILVGSTQSNSTTGYFEISSIYDEPHYVVVLPLIGEGYNLLGYDNINPELF